MNKFFWKGKKAISVVRGKKRLGRDLNIFLENKTSFFDLLEMTQEDEKYSHLEICLIIEKRWLD